MDWSTWVQDVSAGIIGKAAEAKYVTPYEVQKLQLQALGPGGYYREGQAGTLMAGQAGGFNPALLLLIGAAVVGVMLLKD